jgi:hypothetical protein
MTVIAALLSGPHGWTIEKSSTVLTCLGFKRAFSLAVPARSRPQETPRNLLIDAVSSHSTTVPEGPDPDERIDDDPNRCSACGGTIANGVRLIHEDGGPLCLPCARMVMPAQTEEAERMWQKLNQEGPGSE